MAWTGFGGEWNDGEHSGGDDSGSIGGGGIKLDGKGNPIGVRAPSQSDIASQWNSYGGDKISPGDVSSIVSNGDGTYSANIANHYHTVTSWGNGGLLGSKYSNKCSGFTGVSSPLTNSGRGIEGGMSNWNDAAKSIREGNIPLNFKLKNNTVGIMAPKIQTRRKGGGDTYDVRVGEEFVEIPALTKAYQEGKKEREEIQNAVKFTADLFKELTEKFGAHSSAIAKELSDAAKGKKIRNVEQALKTLGKFNSRFNKVYGRADREAIALALKSVNRKNIAKDLVRFGKVFNLTSKAIDIYDILWSELPKAIRSQNYRGLLIKLETLVLASDAAAITAWVFSVLLRTPLGIVGFAVIMVLMSALITDKKVDALFKLMKI